MLIRTILVVCYLLSCLCLLAAPWRFFGLNRHYFNKQKGIYSKQFINDLIPAAFQLRQWFDHVDCEPENYPVFIKPEWGQNSKGVQRVDNLAQLKSVRTEFCASAQKHRLLVQESAQGAIEFEVFALANSKSSDEFGYLSITQVVNAGQSSLPVNGIHNPQTSYLDISDQFSKQELRQLWLLLRPIGNFNICRFGIKADSKFNILTGLFSIIEINLLLPMPMVLLCSNRSFKAKVALAMNLTWKMALLTRKERQVHWLRARSPSPLNPSITKQGEQ